jgi:glycosyltransferase involved in cell wall biosynthesis
MRSKIRVLMITSEWPTPGQPRTTHFVKRQVDFLQAAGIDVDVFQFKAFKNPVNYLKAWVKAQRKLMHEHYDLVHAQFGHNGLLALPKRIPLVVTFRGSDLLGIVGDKDGRYTRLSKIAKQVSQMVATRADAVILVSEHMKDHLRASIQAQVIPSGINFDVFRCIPRDEARRRLGLPLEERLVLFVGRPSQKRKRFEISKRAVEILNLSLPTRLIVAWGVPHSDIPLFMNACDALVFTSMQEGSPDTVKEALACNLPVVSVPVGDVAFRLQGIEGCELCVDDNPETVAASLERVLRRGQRIAGRERVRDLDEKIITRQVIDIYQSILMKKPTIDVGELAMLTNT